MRHTDIQETLMMNKQPENNVSIYKIESGSYMIKTGNSVTIIRFNA